MKMLATETFERSWDCYYDKLSEEEFAAKLVEHIELELPGVPSEYRYGQIVSMGGSRSSKSYSILQLLLLEMISRDNLKITVWRNLKNICRSTVMEDFQKIIMFDPQVYEDIKENKQTGTFTYMPTGSKIVFEGADNIGKVLGSAQDISFFNEVTEFNNEVYLQITQRTAERVICDYNPSKDFWLENARLDPDSIFIHSNFKDNQYCPPRIVRRLMGYEPWLPGSYEFKDGKLFYLGIEMSRSHQPPPHPTNIDRKTANEYMWKVYGLGLGAEKPHKIYSNWHEIEDDFYEQLDYDEYFGMDFGSVNPTAIIGVKYGGDGDFYIKERMYKPLQSIDDSLPTAVKLYAPEVRKGHSLIVGDSAKEKYITMLQNAGYNAVGAIKGAGSVEVGITLIQGFTIYYVNTEGLKKEYDLYSWMLDRNGKSTDIPDKQNDHLCDSLRYLITYLVEYLGIEL